MVEQHLVLQLVRLCTGWDMVVAMAAVTDLAMCRASILVALMDLGKLLEVGWLCVTMHTALPAAPAASEDQNCASDQWRDW